MDTFVLVVMEHASAWPAHIPGPEAGCVALQQGSREGHGELLRRTYERARALEQAGAAIEVAVLSCSDDPSIGALERRVPLARALLATVLRRGDGRLDLVARWGAPDRAKQSLVALAGMLIEALVGTSASVSARFTGPASRGAAAGSRRRDVHPRRPAA